MNFCHIKKVEKQNLNFNAHAHRSIDSAVSIKLSNQTKQNAKIQKNFSFLKKKLQIRMTNLILTVRLNDSMIIRTIGKPRRFLFFFHQFSLNKKNPCLLCLFNVRQLKLSRRDFLLSLWCSSALIALPTYKYSAQCLCVHNQ